MKSVKQMHPFALLFAAHCRFINNSGRYRHDISRQFQVCAARYVMVP